MSAKTQLAGVTDFLQAVYGPETRLSALLAREGYTEPQLAQLRDQYLDSLLQAFVAAISDRIAQYHGGDRKVFILVRRFSLDGQPRATLQDLATQLGISKERVRQVEASALHRCRFGKNRDYWPEALHSIARSLLIGVPEPGSRVAGSFSAIDHKQLTALIGAARGERSNTSVAAYSRVPVAIASEPSPREMHDLVDSVRAAVGSQPYWIFAHILYGSRGPTIDALVARYEPPYYGALRGFGFKRVKHLVEEAVNGKRRDPAQIASSSLSEPQVPDQPLPDARLEADDGECAPFSEQDSGSGSEGPALLQRLAECGEDLPSVVDVQAFLDLRTGNPTADTHARLDRWLRVHRGRAAASWLCLEDERARSDALPGEIGAMCCWLAPLAEQEDDLERKTRLSGAILSCVSAGMDHVGRIPAGMDLVRLSAAFAALIACDDTLGVRDLWLKRLADEKGRLSDKATDRLWRRLLPSR